MAKKKKFTFDTFALVLGILAILFTVAMIIWTVVR